MEPEENNAKNTYIRKYYFKNICGKIGAEIQIDQELSEKNCRSKEDYYFWKREHFIFFFFDLD